MIKVTFALSFGIQLVILIFKMVSVNLPKKPEIFILEFFLRILYTVAALGNVLTYVYFKQSV